MHAQWLGLKLDADVRSLSLLSRVHIMSGETIAVDAEMTLWCAGLPYAEDRLLSELERSEIQHNMRRLNRYCWLLAMSVVPTLAISICAGPVLLGKQYQTLTSNDIERNTLYVSILGFSCISFAIEIYLAIRALKHKWDLASDVQTGLVSVYRGVLAERNRLEPTQLGLLATHLLRLDSSEKQTIELLKTSRVVWRVNGLPTKRTIQPTLTEVAATPPFASIAAQWLEPVSRHEKSILYGGKRELSDNEKRELRRFVRRLVTRPATSSLPVAFLSLALAANLYHARMKSTEIRCSGSFLLEASQTSCFTCSRFDRQGVSTTTFA